METPDDAPRASAQDLLGPAGAPPEIAHAGTTYRLCPDQAAAARYEELVAAWAVDNVARLQGKVPADAYADLWAGLQADVKARQYGRGGSLWAAAMSSPDGDALFLAALMGADRAAAAAALAADPDRVGLALARAVPDFLGHLLTGLPGLTPEAVRQRVGEVADRLRERAGRGS